MAGPVNETRRARQPVRAALRIWRSPRASLAVLAAGIAAFLTSRLLPLLPLHDVLTYGSGPGALLSRALSLITGAVPFSVAELILAAWIVWLVTRLRRALQSLIAGRRTAGALLAGGGFRAARHGGAYLVLFYLLWGMNYARPTLADQAAWQRAGLVDARELRRLAEAATAATNRAYVALHGVDDTGEPTRMPRDLRGLDQSLGAGWEHAAALLPLPRAAAHRFGRVKQPLASPLITQLNIAGMYVPFTGEANVVYGLPALRMPLTMAHEQAHQRGIARESDANFVAFIVAAHAPDALSRYAAAYFAMQQLYNQLTWMLPAAELRELVDLRLPGVRRDIRDLYAWYAQTDGVVSDFGGSVNGFFLNLNGIEGGTADYGRSVFLLVEWARMHGGELMPADSARAP